MKEKLLHVSCVQMQPRTGDLNYNLDRMEKYIEEVMLLRPNTNLIVFPELITSGYDCTKDEFLSIADTVPDGQSILKIGKLCMKYSVNIVYGFPEIDLSGDRAMYNSAVFIDNNGQILGIYRKVHPFGTEKQWCEAGVDFPVFETPFGHVGIMVCWDTAFPEVAGIYALKGAELIILVSNWEKPFSDGWDLITRTRAYDNTLHLVAANRVGKDRNLDFFGRSKIVDPMGKVLMSLDEDTEGIIYATLNLSLTRELRNKNRTMLKERQPNLYAEIVR